MRVVHCPVNVAGIPWENVQALRRKAVDARLVVVDRGKLHPEADWSLDRRGGFTRQQLTPSNRPGPVVRPAQQNRHGTVTEVSNSGYARTILLLSGHFRRTCPVVRPT